MSSGLLAQILAHKREEAARLDLREMQAQASLTPRASLPGDGAARLEAAPASPLPIPFGATPAKRPSPFGRGGKGQGWGVRVIAELKPASPSRGPLAPGRDMLELAHVYAANGAAAISVLTDERFFRGSPDTLRRLADPDSPHHLPGVPLLRKDFIVSPAQVYQTRALGASLILLIVAALEQAELAELHALSLELGLTPLVEMHTAAELDRALRLPGLRLAGINNRDLETFHVSLDTTARLRPLVPPGIPVVSESGIHSAADMRRLEALDVQAALVGEALLTAPDVVVKMRELTQATRNHSPAGVVRGETPRFGV